MDDDIKQLKDVERELLNKGEEEGRIEDGHESNMAWITGLGLIGIGTTLLLMNFTNFRLNNWWALFILIPAFGSLGNFVRAYRANDGMDDEARGSLIGSMVLFFIVAIFLFGLNWGQVWPVFLIIGGIGALLTALLNRK